MNKKSNYFALLGSSGFIARKHVSVIKSLKKKLILAYDDYNNSGYLDSQFPDCYFSKNEKEFFQLVKKKKISYVVICTPNYLHFSQIKKSLLNGANVICEKPTVLHIEDLEKLIKVENQTKKKCFSLFQLRYNKDISNLKPKLVKFKKDINIVKLNYVTYRGSWYENSWKNNPKLSGGLIMNIGVHFVDILTLLFGELVKISFSTKTLKTLKGSMFFKNSRVNFLLSIEKRFLFKIDKPIRDIYLNSYKINLTERFTNLHTKCYNEILAGKGIPLSKLLPTFKNLKKIQHEINK